MAELSKNAQKIMDLVKEMGAVELNDLVKSLEEEFGVTAAATVVAGAGAAGWDWGDDAGASDTMNVELSEIWQQKIAVIKVIKELLWVWLKEAKEMVEKAPVVVKEGVKSEEADAIKAKLEGNNNKR